MRGLTKRFGSFTAVDDLDFDVEPGRDHRLPRPQRRRQDDDPAHAARPRARHGAARRPSTAAATPTSPTRCTVVGSALEATNFHPGRTGRNHLRVQAAAAGVPTRASTSCSSSSASPPPHASGRAATRWACASGSASPRALLGDPRVLILDEPANGLDPEGIRWLRGFLRHLADEGRTLLISSHMLSEVEQTVDDVVIIANGRRVAQGTVAELRGEPTAYVRTSDPDRLSAGAARPRAHA